MASALTFLKAFLALWPVIKILLDLWIKTPEEKRSALISNIHDAFNKAEETGGDTSDLEDLIRRGK